MSYLFSTFENILDVFCGFFLRNKILLFKKYLWLISWNLYSTMSFDFCLWQLCPFDFWELYFLFSLFIFEDFLRCFLLWLSHDAVFKYFLWEQYHYIFLTFILEKCVILCSENVSFTFENASHFLNFLLWKLCSVTFYEFFVWEQ